MPTTDATRADLTDRTLELMAPPQLAARSWLYTWLPATMSSTPRTPTYAPRFCGPTTAGPDRPGLIGRYYERFADHAVSAARRLHFAATGRL